ncbi:hypothetical protein ANN_17210, partial [Periplaneta americana]
MKPRSGGAGKTSNTKSPSNPGRSKPAGTGNNADIVCDVCGQAFDNVTVAIQHKFRKHPESAAKHFCPHCGMQFPLKINRDKHVAAEHSGGAPSKLFPCSDCGVVFYTEEAQSYHTKSTHKRSARRLWQMWFRDLLTDVICLGKLHKSQGAVRASREWTTTDRGVQFPWIDGTLVNRGICSGTVFWSKDTAECKQNIVIVALFKPVATPPPTKKIKVNNAGEAQSVYYCHLCGFEYIVKFNLQKHLERQHSEQERNKVPEDLIKCTTCDALFYNKRAYDNHNMYHKPDDLYVTSEEQRLQTVSRVDQDFDIRRVQTTAEKFIPVYRPRGRPAQQQPPQK